MKRAKGATLDEVAGGFCCRAGRIRASRAAGFPMKTQICILILRNYANLRDIGGDPVLFNQYGSILVNPQKFRSVKAADARRWHEWLTSAAGRAAISSYKIKGEQLFFPFGDMPRS
jgi:hypothetical protein